MSRSSTIHQYEQQISICRDIFLKKTKDYGTSWRILRPKSVTDQIFIKAQRIKTLEETVERKVNEGIEPEFIGIINYAIMGLIQMILKEDKTIELNLEETLAYYDKQVKEVKDLMIAKNHDYGEAWRDMRVSSFTDLILMKLLRIKQIEDNSGKTIISEGIDAGYMDIVNYAVFALIQMSEGKM